MQARIIHYGPWQIPIRCEHALCPDGRRRNVKITREADTFWTLPAKVTYRGTSVSGWIMTRTDEHGCSLDTVDYVFVPGGKHADIFSGKGK